MRNNLLQPTAGDHWTENYRNADMSAKVNYAPAPVTCPKWKIENDEGCEFFDVKAKTIFTPKGDKPVTYSGVGHCGC